MILRPASTATKLSYSLPQFLVPSLAATSTASSTLNSCLTAHRRQLHSSLPRPPIPSPTPFVPDASTFLTLIGRKLSQHASKIPDWNSLFSLTSRQLRELGVEPARSRRYLLWWRERFRQGKYGVGGDLNAIIDGVGEVRLIDGKGLISVKPGEEATGNEDIRKKVEGVKVRTPGVLSGNYFQTVKGTEGKAIRIKVMEGMWEVKRGVKLFGGERRRKNVLSRIAARERGTLK